MDTRRLSVAGVVFAQAIVTGWPRLQARGAQASRARLDGCFNGRVRPMVLPVVSSCASVVSGIGIFVGLTLLKGSSGLPSPSRSSRV